MTSRCATWVIWRRCSTQAQVEALPSIDVLLTPVGGGGALDADDAAEVISMLEPRIVIPMHYQTEIARL